MLEGKNDVERVLTALSEQLAAQGVDIIEMVVCGGAAMNILGHVVHKTEDIDVVAHVEKNRKLKKGLPSNPLLYDAARRVQKDFNLSKNWLNERPKFLLDLGLPKGLMKRAKIERYGSNLVVHFIGRYDQICFKLYAAVDEFKAKHIDDLIALKPTVKELEDAAHWCISASPAKGYEKIIKDFLEKIGYKDVAEKL